MCGITGILGKGQRSVKRHVLESMTHVLTHRGPDDYGTKIIENIGLGHRRLSIIDLETGAQPLCNEDRTIWITYNGEIYNYKELRTQLEIGGHRFQTRSDTEVIIHAYEEWGDDCVMHFRGMFAFGIADTRKKRMLLARDHFGIKPLYYLQTGEWFAFASEIQAFKRIPGLELAIDLQALDQYLWLQYIPAPLSIFKQVKKLPPASRMSISFAGKVNSLETYWAPEFSPDYSRTEAEWLEEWEAVVKDSVRAHLVSDVPFGAFLSGGIDSAAVTAYMAQVLEHPVKTFSIGFEEQEYNELPYAGIVAERWRTEHHEEVVTPDAIGILPGLVRHYGEPFGDSSAVPTYYVAKLAKEYVPMVLSGDGGDELFAGYRSYMKWMTSIQKKKNENPVNLDNWLKFIHYMPLSLRRSLWRPEYKHTAFLPLEFFEKEFEKARHFDSCHNVQYMDIKTYLPFDILTKVDIAAMMHGLEVRTPLVDVTVAETAMRMPGQINLRKDKTGLWTGKWVPKKVIETYYPRDFIHRPKKGFRFPVQKWFTTPGMLDEYLHDKMLSSNARLLDFFQPEAVKRIMEGDSGRHQWLLLFLEEWLQQYRGTGVESVDFDVHHFSLEKKYNSVEECEFNLELAALYGERGQYDRAEIIFDLLLDQHYLPMELRSKTYYRRASLYRQKEKYNEAEKWFRRVIDESQNNSLKGGAYFHLGEIYFRTGRKKESREFFRMCMEMIPGHGKAGQYLRRLHQ